MGKDRETASHLWRMYWMGYDRVVHGVSHRWAYIAMSGDRGIDSRFDDFEFNLGKTIAEGHSVCEVKFLRKQ